MGKAQVAMEFLMTYGWALLIILLAVAALAYYGITNTERFAPDICTLPTGMACLSHRVLTTEVLLNIQNIMGEDITVNSIAVSGCSETFSTSLINSAKANFTIDGCVNGAVGKKYKSDITITYADEEGIVHQVRGELISSVEMSTEE